MRGAANDEDPETRLRQLVHDAAADLPRAVEIMCTFCDTPWAQHWPTNARVRVMFAPDYDLGAGDDEDTVDETLLTHLAHAIQRKHPAPPMTIEQVAQRVLALPHNQIDAAVRGANLGAITMDDVARYTLAHVAHIDVHTTTPVDALGAVLKQQQQQHQQQHHEDQDDDEVVVIAAPAQPPSRKRERAEKVPVDVAALLAEVRALCDHDNDGGQAVADPINIEQRLERALANNKQHRSDMARLKFRGWYISTRHAQGAAWSDIAAALGIEAKKPDSSSAITTPHKFFQLMIVERMYKLRRLQLDKPDRLLRRLAVNYMAIVAYFRANPDEHAWWFDGQEAPRTITDANNNQCVDEAWMCE